MSELSDSSDDDVCFGPYTIKEAKRDWRKYVGKKVDRRHSTACVIKQLKMLNETPALLNRVEEISISTSNSKCPSEYLTPNDTMSSERSSQNSEFLEKLRQVIDEPSQASSYATALDHTSNQYQSSANTTNLDSIYVTLVENTRCFQDSENDVNESSEETNEYSKVKEDTKEINEDSVITISDESQSLSESFCAVESKKCLDVSSSPYMLSEEYKYEEPICATSDLDFSTNENEADQSSLGIISLNSSDIEPKTRDYSCNLILEDSLENFEEQCITSDLEKKPMKYSCDTDIQGSLLGSKEQYNYSEESDIHSNNLLVPHSNNRYGRVIVDCNHLSKISERTEYNSCIDGSVETQQKLPLQSEADSNSYDNISKDSQINIKEYGQEYDIFNSSPKTTASTPEQMPATNDTSHQFDDTLEEITHFLAQGEDYVMPEVTPSKYTPNSKQRASVIISASFLNKSNPTDKLENKRPNKSPFESKIKPPSVVSGRLLTKPPDKQADDFKVPIKPLKKITTPSKFNTNLSLKNIVSPVGVYIKNSPKYCPMLKANKMKNTPQKTFTRDKTPMKENIPSTSNMELPMVIYRPAKNKHTRDDERLKLPENIKKLVGAQSIIKHEERIHVANCNESIERRLMESDFSIDASCSNDISILTNKQPFKT